MKEALDLLSKTRIALTWIADQGIEKMCSENLRIPSSPLHLASTARQLSSFSRITGLRSHTASNRAVYRSTDIGISCRNLTVGCRNCGLKKLKDLAKEAKGDSLSAGIAPKLIARE